MEKITTATGKTVDCDYFVPFPPAGMLTLKVYGLSLVEVLGIFSDSAETKTLCFGNQTAEGYTSFVAIGPAGDGCRVMLRKE